MLDVAIIGNGIAGNEAAETIKEYRPKSKISIISDEEQPLYSLPALPYYLEGSIEEDSVFLKEMSDYREAGIETYFGNRVTNLDLQNSEIVLKNNERVAWKKLIIATGALPIIPPIQGCEREKVFTLGTFKDFKKIREINSGNAVVIGAGAIGVEASIALRRRGFQVSLVEMEDRILPKMFDEEFSALIRKNLEEKGIRVLKSERVKNIKGEESVDKVLTGQTCLDCDLVILSAGMRPNIEIAKESGIKLGDEYGGIKVDEDMKTNEKNVYACGDCVESTDFITGESSCSMFWHNTIRQAKIAGYNCIFGNGNKKRYEGNLDLSSIQIFDKYCFSVGLTENSTDKNLKKKFLRKGDSQIALLYHDNEIVGTQFFGDISDSKRLISSTQRKDNIKSHKMINPSIFSTGRKPIESFFL